MVGSVSWGGRGEEGWYMAELPLNTVVSSLSWERDLGAIAIGVVGRGDRSTSLRVGGRLILI